jgi:hypothetical protein
MDGRYRGLDGGSIFHYARISDIETWLMLGWLPHDSLAGTKHAEFAVLVEWICPSCLMKRPNPVR